MTQKQISFPYRRGNRLLRRILSCWQLYVLIIPAMIYLFLFNYLPMYGVQIAFKDYRVSKGIAGSSWVGLKHFIQFINYPDFWLIVRNTLTLSVYNMLTFPIPVLFALLLDEMRFPKSKKVVQMITYAPHFLSTVVIVSMLTLFFSRSNGLVNNVLNSVGIARFSFLEDPDSFADLYVWSGVWQSFGWNSNIYLAALSGLSQENREAAIIDGANRFQMIWHVNIPTILPTIVVMLILNCGRILTIGFDKVYLMQNALNLQQSRIISTYVYEIGLKQAQFSYSSAIDLFNNVVNIILLIIVNDVSKRLSDVSLF